jgi:Peptidase A4 family
VRKLTKLVLLAAMVFAALPAATSSARTTAPRPQSHPLTLQGFHSEPLHPLSAAVRAHSIGAHAIGAHDAVSSNWSGLLDTGTTFTGVGASWIVPTVRPTIPLEISGTWIGIDGGANESYPGIIQTGTVQATGDGQTLYDAWYELFPQTPVYLGWAVNPGDAMNALIKETSPEHWFLTISDTTLGQSFGSTFFYQGPALSAEWIEEPPGDTFGGQATLPDFGSVTFSNLSVTGANLAVVLVDPVQLEDPLTGQVLASSTGLLSNDSVTVTYAKQGYDLVGADGGFFNFGTAAFYGSMGGTTLNAPIVGIVSDNVTGGYWMVASDGGVFAFNAPFDGSMGGTTLNAPVVGMVSDDQTGGYWMVASDGGVFAFNAPFYGSMGGSPLSQPVVGIAATPDGAGYWLVAKDGGVFAFGDAPFDGSMGGTPLDAPVVGMATDTATNGYWLVASDGGVFAFNAPFDGSMGGTPLDAPVVGMAATRDANGYWFVGSDGGVFAFGDALFEGSMGGTFLNARVVGMAVT